jgi:hypothetical protein
MKFKNYCIIVLGKTDGCLTEINKVAEGKVKILPAKGIMIGTFNSAFKTPELDDYFKSLNRNFFIFELNPKTSGYNINNEEVRHDLFGKSKDNNIELEKISNNLIDDIKSVIPRFNKRPVTGSSKSFIIDNNEDNLKFSSDFYETLNPKEKQTLMDSILDKGVDNLTYIDKEILNILTKK